MPKIIPDLKARILETAARHFETKGFATTDMKSLAVDLGISVGTLYNYYPSKPELFLEVSLLWKEALSRRMLDRMAAGGSAQERLRDTLLILFDDMVNYTGIWQEFMRSGAPFSPGTPVGERFRKDNEELNAALQDLFREVWKGHPGAQALLEEPENRLARLIVGSIMQLVMGQGDDRESTARFVRHWIDFLAPAP